jgi:cell division protein FtsB
MKIRKPKRVPVFAIIALPVIALLGIRFPAEYTELRDKQHKIRELQDENAELEKRLRHREERLMKLQQDQTLLELEIRRKLNLHRQDETVVVLPPEEDTP